MAIAVVDAVDKQPDLRVEAVVAALSTDAAYDHAIGHNRRGDVNIGHELRQCLRRVDALLLDLLARYRRDHHGRLGDQLRPVSRRDHHFFDLNRFGLGFGLRSSRRHGPRSGLAARLSHLSVNLAWRQGNKQANLSSCDERR